MKNVRQSNISIHRDSWVEINLENLAHNIKEIRRNLPQGKQLLAVVKADAYGHGAVMLAPTILASGCDMLGVASIDEGIDLRNAKIGCEILVLGAVPVWAVENAVKADISISIFSKEHLTACKQAYERTGIMPKVHVKIDTGMNRIGVQPGDAVDFISEVQNASYLMFQGVFTHLYEAESVNEAQKQINIWNNIISQIDTKGLLLHIQNTAGTLCYDVPTSNMLRIGIGLYGLAPDYPTRESLVCQAVGGELLFTRKDFVKPDLKPVMSLKGRIVHIHEMKAGEGVSYCHTFKTDKPIKVATIPVGYADGVSRLLSNKITAELNGKKVRQIGNITMDQMMFDITGVEANVGDVITLISPRKSRDKEHGVNELQSNSRSCKRDFGVAYETAEPRVDSRERGEQVAENCFSGDGAMTMDEWAEILGTINYELTCRLKVRLPRVYTR